MAIGGNAMQYYVVMIRYARRYTDKGTLIPAADEAVVDPDISRREVVARIRSGEYKNIRFIHEVRDGIVTDVTDEIQSEAEREAA